MQVQRVSYAKAALGVALPLLGILGTGCPSANYFSSVLNASLEAPTSLTVTSVSPNIGYAGFVVSIAGYHFDPAVSVTVNAIPCGGVAFFTENLITCALPSGPSLGGPYDIKATNPDLTTFTLAAAISYVNPPGVSSVSPTFGPVAGGSTITVTGTDFYPGAIAKINAVSCLSTSVLSSTSLTCVVPAGALGLYTVSVTNADGRSGSLGSSFSYVSPPTIGALAASFGPTAGGQNLVVTGTGFFPGVYVSINGVGCTSTSYDSPTQATCTTAAQAAGGPYGVTITNLDGQSGTLASAYEYAAAPVLSSVNLSFGSTSGGNAITLTGSGFRPGATVNIAGGACTTVNVTSSTSISCVTPAAALGFKTVSVTNPDGQSSPLANAYEYVSAPTVTGVSPSTIAATLSSTITVTGTGFRPGADVKIGGVSCLTSTSGGAVTYTCDTPTNAPAGLIAVTLVNADGQSGTSAPILTVVPAPTISSCTPSAGSFAGGTLVQISGTNFANPAVASLDGVPCTATNFINPTQVNCIAPSHLPTTPSLVDVRVVNPDGQLDTFAGGFVYDKTQNLDVAIEMVDRAISSISVSQIFNGTTIDFDPSEYDGVTARDFVVVATNADAAPKNVWLVDSGAIIKSTVTVPGSTLVPTRFSAPISPLGADTYRVSLDGTITPNDLKITAARMVITQRNASKTRLHFPLSAGDFLAPSSSPAGAFIDSTSVLSFSRPNASAYLQWRRPPAAEIASIAAGAPWRLEGVMSSPGNTASLALFNSSSLPVAGAVASVSGPSPAHLSVDFVDNATNFDPGQTLHAEIQVSPSGIANLFRASLSVALNPIDQAEVYRRISGQYSNVGSGTLGGSFDAIDRSPYYGPWTAAFFEATAWVGATASASLQIIDIGNMDTWGAGSPIAGSTLNYTFAANSAPGLQRTGDLSGAMGAVTPPHRFGLGFSSTGGPINVNGGSIVIKLRNTP